ncbi:MAG TPA: hypothetical protein VLK88_08115 [Gemmatimonadales bacterium]|nr:hypothetical protein [Gemmatimonadales bacterium]
MHPEESRHSGLAGPSSFGKMQGNDIDVMSAVVVLLLGLVTIVSMVFRLGPCTERLETHLSLLTVSRGRTW